jgi:hypothetical protein
MVADLSGFARPLTAVAASVREERVKRFRFQAKVQRKFQVELCFGTEMAMQVQPQAEVQPAEQVQQPLAEE